MTQTKHIIAGDIGGTNARFCIATLAAGRVSHLSPPVTLQTNDHASLASAFATFTATLPHPAPGAGAIAIACPISGDILKLTNSPWVIRPATLAAELGLEELTLINDFAAVGHAVTALPHEHLRPIAGPDTPLPEDGVISIIGPGTGLGVAHILRHNGASHIMPGEGGHIDFAPVDSIEDAILAQLRRRYGRVSVERIVSGPGLKNLYEALAAIESRPVALHEDKTIWAAAAAAADPLAASALARFFLMLGTVTGDLALAQGASAVVLAGGILPRHADALATSGFATRFTAKGRLERLMSAIPIKLITHPHPGLLGAATAFATA
jgi:glucokinase